MARIRSIGAQLGRLWVIIPLALLLLPANGASHQFFLPLVAAGPPPGTVPRFSHVFTIVMENKAYESIIDSASAPYLNGLAQQYGLATRYYAIRHPSLPNYIALISGDTQGITNDCTSCFIDAPNLADQIEASGRSWRAYMESMPSPCYVGDSGTYRQKHNPFIYFDSIRQDPARCARIVPLSQLDYDLASDALPDYVWITPDMCSDTHDCPISTGDAWLSTWVPRILASPAWRNGGVLFITYDESVGSDSRGCCRDAAGGQVVTLVISPLGLPGYRSAVAYDHYGLLRTVEESWGLPALGHAACDCALPLVDFFGSVSSP